MEFKTYTLLTLVVFSSAAFAWQPLTYPIRSQSPYQRSIDTAMCYARRTSKPRSTSAANRRFRRASRLASKTRRRAHRLAALAAQHLLLRADRASMPAADRARRGEPRDHGGDRVRDGRLARPGEQARPAGHPATAATAASATTADTGASETAAASRAQMSAASSVKLPPLPAPDRR